MVKYLVCATVIVLFNNLLFSQSTFTVTKKTTLSSAEQYLLLPKWSPDGNFIAAAGKNYGAIWVCDIKTKNWKQLVEENGAGWDFAWSPDSKNIAFRGNVFLKKRKKTTIKYVNITSGKGRKIVEYDRNFSTPKWITNHHIAFLHQDEYKLVSISPDQVLQDELNRRPQNICLASDKGIFTKLNRGEIELLAPLEGQTFNASFSPDGQMILYEKPNKEIFILPAGAASGQLIAHGEMPAWSPDGKYIVYATPKDDGHRFVSSDIFICDALGNKAQNITQTDDALELRPDWSPDGKRIICEANGKIILIDLKME